MYETVSEEFGVPVASLRGGFPPRPIPSEDSTPISNFVSNQERVQVEFAVTEQKSSKKNKGDKKKICSPSKSVTDDPNNASSSSGTRRSKRSASKAATEAMPAVIKAQEEYLKSNAPSGKKRARNTKNSDGISRMISSGNNQQRRSNQPKSVKLSASAGTGRRLADGATVANPSRTGRQAATRRRRGDVGSSGGSTDMSTALMGALNDKGKMGTILRKGMKNAVLTSYETTRSFSRLAAIQARSYQMTNLTGDNNLSGGGGSDLLMVTYQGSVDKTKVDETVDCIPRDVLQAVLEGIHASNKEALRPENLSRLSPRVLWSCVKCFPAQSSVPDMYRELLPALDWRFLRRRAEQLSEKAMENKRQAMDEAEGLDLERASNVVAAVEHAMEHLQDYHAEERKARQTQAAEARLRRLQQQNSVPNEGANDATWVLSTPSEPDRDELRECIETSVPDIGSNTRTNTTKWISQLMKEHRIHNWRELANVSDEQFGSIVSKLGITDLNLRSWIDNAQNESVSEIMVEICDSNIEAVEILTEHARSGTPKDLSGWKSIPDLLLEELRRKCSGQEYDWMELGTISTWCDRAHHTLQDYEWLNWYATPIE